MNAPIEKMDGWQGLGAIAFEGLTRRSFLLSSGGLAIAVAFGGLAGSKGARAQASQLEVNAWVEVGTDNIVTIQSAASEMGQGVRTSMPLCLAEDMDLDWSRVRVEQAPANPRAFGNPLFGGNMVTGASRTTRGYYVIMRLAGMQAREILLQNAARRLGVPVSDLTTEPSVVVHRASGRRLTYGQIAAFAEVPAKPPNFAPQMLKPMKEFRLIGKDVQRVDTEDKVNGRAKYGLDTRIPGMMYAAILRAPVNGEGPANVDESGALKVPGVKKVVRLPYAVAVVGDTFAAALKGRRAVKVTWTRKSKARDYNPDKLIAEYTQRARNVSDSGVVYEKHGDARGAMAKAAKRMSAEFSTLNVTHMCMEPINCTALVEGDRIEFWAPTQSPSLVMLAAIKGLGFKPQNVKVNVTYLGGGFGRRAENDYAIDAGIVAKAMPGVPVKLIWTREEDVQHTRPRPLTVQRLEAGLDAQGNIVAMHHRIVSESIYARFAPPLFQKSGGRDTPVCEGAFEQTYHYPNFELDYLREQRGVDVAVWRAVGPGYTKFAIETFIDEIAAASGKDPVAYRLQLLAKEPRAQKVIRDVVEMSNYSRARPAGRAVGLAYSDAWETHIAMVCEVSIQKSGKVRVHEVWAAVDAGVAVQPLNLQRQIESSVMYGTSALYEALRFKDGEVQQSNYHDYPVLRMDEAPLVTVKVVVTDNKPGGIGEVGLPPVAPAVGAAVFKLTGKRLHHLPFDQKMLMKA